MQQITPPAMVIRNDNPKLAVEPTVVVPPQIKLPPGCLELLGDPKSAVPSGPASNGTGMGGGIGSGSGGGIGAAPGRALVRDTAAALAAESSAWAEA